MNSSIVQSATQTSRVSSTGVETYVTFTDLVKRYGDRIAKQMRAEKRRLQEGQGSNSSDPPYVMAHPDLPGNEDRYTCGKICSMTIQLHILLEHCTPQKLTLLKGV
jgi:hypothetical protein